MAEYDAREVNSGGFLISEGTLISPTTPGSTVVTPRLSTLRLREDAHSCQLPPSEAPFSSSTRAMNDPTPPFFRQW
ncbi:hypothetical protein K1719_033659 [Acacia pycnantha]|nr:hypothetical protein K1719_033659 [Acacia pycnantha]